MVQHRRLHDRALDAAAGCDPGALRRGVPQELGDPLDRFEIDDRAEDGIAFRRVARRQRGGLGGELADEGVGDRLIDHEALGRHADLSLIHERAESRRIHRRVEIGVVEHDHRRLAAQFEQHRLQMRRRGSAR